MTLKHAKCVRWAITGVSIGWLFAGYAMAQDVASPPMQSGLPADLDLLARLVGAGGLPAVAGWLAWTLARMGPLTIRVVHVDGSAPLSVSLTQPVTVKPHDANSK